jgi:hypothetical protein
MSMEVNIFNHSMTLGLWPIFTFLSPVIVVSKSQSSNLSRVIFSLKGLLPLAASCVLIHART